MKKINLFVRITMFLSLVSVSSSRLYGDIISLPNGDIYKGDTRDGKMDGYGIIYYANGGYVEGKWDKGEIDDEYIKVVFSNGNSFIVYSMFNGKYSKCIMTYANGDFKEQYMIGKEVIKHEKIRKTYKDGSVYEGDVIKEIPNGIGKITYKNGTSYKGEFKNGMLTIKFACIMDSCVVDEEGL